MFYRNFHIQSTRNSLYNLLRFLCVRWHRFLQEISLSPILQALIQLPSVKKSPQPNHSWKSRHHMTTSSLHDSNHNYLPYQSRLYKSSITNIVFIGRKNCFQKFCHIHNVSFIVHTTLTMTSFHSLRVLFIFLLSHNNNELAAILSSTALTQLPHLV